MGTSSSTQSSKKPEKQSIENTSMNLLAWCSRESNTISVVDLKTKKELAHFDGVKLKYGTSDDQTWPRVKEIPNSSLLVSTNEFDDSAALQIFDVNPRKKQAKSIYRYSLEESRGNIGDLVYNSKRGFLAALSAKGKIAYHLYGFETSKSGDTVKLIRKSRWDSQRTWNTITGFDFHPAGELIASIDYNSTCLISHVDTNNYRFHFPKVGKEMDIRNCCRWSTNSCDPILYVKHTLKSLDIFDTEKKVRILKEPYELEPHVSGAHYSNYKFFWFTSFFLILHVYRTMIDYRKKK